MHFLKLWVIKKILKKRSGGLPHQDHKWRIYACDRGQDFELKEENYIDYIIEKSIYNISGNKIPFDNHTKIKILTLTDINSKDEDGLTQGLWECFIFNIVLRGKIRYRINQARIWWVILIGPDNFKVAKSIRKRALKCEGKYYTCPQDELLKEYGHAGCNNKQLSEMYNNIFKELLSMEILKLITMTRYAYNPNGFKIIEDSKNQNRNRWVKFMAPIIAVIVSIFIGIYFKSK